jgi:hypothetical protein
VSFFSSTNLTKKIDPETNEGFGDDVMELQELGMREICNNDLINFEENGDVYYHGTLFDVKIIQRDGYLGFDCG